MPCCGSEQRGQAGRRNGRAGCRPRGAANGPPWPGCRRGRRARRAGGRAARRAAARGRAGTWAAGLPSLAARSCDGGARDCASSVIPSSPCPKSALFEGIRFPPAVGRRRSCRGYRPAPRRARARCHEHDDGHEEHDGQDAPIRGGDAGQHPGDGEARPRGGASARRAGGTEALPRGRPAAAAPRRPGSRRRTGTGW